MPQKTDSPSSHKAIDKMEAALQLVMENTDKYFGKNPSEISDEDFIEVNNSFVKIQPLLSEFLDFWIDSTSIGPDAVLSATAIHERIDVKLFRTGKLDFQRMKKLIMHLSLARILLEELDNIKFHIISFMDLCRGEHEEIVAKMTIVERTLDRVRTCVKDDAETIREAVEMYNLYYRPLVATKALWVASISLCISSIALLLTLLNAFGLL